eukprot:5790240-Ditylum_brightwellii.AAC.1
MEEIIFWHCRTGNIVGISNQLLRKLLVVVMDLMSNTTLSKNMKANFVAHKLLDYWDLDGKTFKDKIFNKSKNEKKQLLDDDDEADADADADDFFDASDNFPHYMTLAPPNDNPTSFSDYWPNHHFVGNIDTD